MKNFLISGLCYIFIISGLQFISCGKSPQDIPAEYSYNSKYYYWDAKEDYWYGNEDFMNANNEFDDKHTISGDVRYLKDSDPRLPNFITPPANDFSRHAIYSCKDCPSFNEITWYLSKGVYWDSETEWTVLGKVFKGGAWLMKKDFIENFSETSPCLDAYNSSMNKYFIDVKDGKPSPDLITKFFFLPALGEFCHGKLNNAEEYCLYWSSTASQSSYRGYYNLNISRDFASLDEYTGTEIHFGYRIWEAK